MDFEIDDNFEINEGFSDDHSHELEEKEVNEEKKLNVDENDDSNNLKVEYRFKKNVSKKVKHSKPVHTKNNNNEHTNAIQWSELNLSRGLLISLNEMHYLNPTPIQSEAIPVILDGRDILATAETGSGKTAAFLLPILERLNQSYMIKTRQQLKKRKTHYPGIFATKVLVILPTRELALQCYDVLNCLSKHLDISKMVVIGGCNQHQQEADLKKKPDIVLATPGRLLDILLNNAGITLDLVEMVVLDEADRLLELGFIEECLEILKFCSKKKQIILFSATLSPKIKHLASLSLKEPVCITASPVYSIPLQLEQILVPVVQLQENTNNIDREAMLLHLTLTKYTQHRIIIFFRTKYDAHRLSLVYRLLNIPHAELHGNLTQNQRSLELKKFQQDTNIRLLICSELVSRGLDIPYVDMVINFMVPSDSIKYIHQIGRTARIGHHGIALTLYSSLEKSDLKLILKNINKNNTHVNFFKLIINPDITNTWKNKIQHLETEINSIIEHEKLEKECKFLEMKVMKSQNYEIYKDEINSRPKKIWLNKKIITNKMTKNKIVNNNTKKKNHQKKIFQNKKINNKGFTKKNK